MKLRILLLAMVSLAFCNLLSAQSSKEEKKKAAYEQLKSAVDARRYTFTAQSATPMSGRSRQLTSIYTLKIHQDTLDSDLPYYGRAYSATPGSTDGGIQFHSTTFDYDAQAETDKGWVIVIAPKNEQSASKMTLNIGSSGYGTLQVNSNNRQMISFYGRVSPNSKSR